MTRHSGAHATWSLMLSIPAAMAFLPMQNPPWPPTYNMSMSTLTMACNSSGWFNNTVGAAFGITSYDVSSFSSPRQLICHPTGLASGIVRQASHIELRKARQPAYCIITAHIS